MKRPSPGSCFGGVGRAGDGTVPIGVGQVDRDRTDPRRHRGGMPRNCGHLVSGCDRLFDGLAADTAGRGDDRELHQEVTV
jgi:hypothetical protein